MKGRSGNRKNGIEKETEKRIYIYMNEREGEREGDGDCSLFSVIPDFLLSLLNDILNRDVLYCEKTNYIGLIPRFSERREVREILYYKERSILLTTITHLS